MNTHDLPMVIFTLFSQMAVGTFVALGVIQLAIGNRHTQQVRARIIAPVLYAIGPVLVIGLLVSMLHMNDITNTFNVIRHPGSSWLSREILFGVSFAAFGFLFALLEWFEKGSYALRQGIAVITAILGVGLLVSESMIYASLEAVPAWHSWFIPLEFFGTAALLGALAVGAALMMTSWVRERRTLSPQADAAEAEPDHGADPSASAAPAGGGLAVQIRERVSRINAPTSTEEWTVTARILRWVAVVGAATSIILLVATPLYLVQLNLGGAAAQESFAILAGPMLAWRLILLGATAFILGFFVYRMAETVTLSRARVLVTVVMVSLVLALTGEFLGRLLHYESMVRMGL